MLGQSIKGAEKTNEVLELSRAVVDCMAGAAQVRSALVSKIASLQDEVDRLQRNAVDGNTVKQLVGALASTGTIDRFNEAYFSEVRFGRECRTGAGTHSEHAPQERNKGGFGLPQSVPGRYHKWRIPGREQWRRGLFKEARRVGKKSIREIRNA